MLVIHKKSALVNRGWFLSFNKKRSIDNAGNPIPWWTYSCIDFLKPRLTKSQRVLEFGCGGSSIWLGQCVKEVISIEDYPKWATEVQNQVSENVTIHLVKHMLDFKNYLNDIKGLFQIIIIDNLGNRMDCAINSLDLLADDGIVIWDDTNGPDWPIINAFMKNKGFREISFTGMSAQEVSLFRTTVFYRTLNCLGL